jgi:phosphoglycerate dehydrogenase-like enzyme
MKPTSIFLLNKPDWAPQILPRVYAPKQRARLEALVDLHPDCLFPAHLDDPACKSLLESTEFIFSTWGMPSLTPEQWAKFPKLRAVFYAAGTVQAFARPLLARDVTVVSAWAANALPVAEFAVAQILLATKSVLRYTRNLRNAGPEQWKRNEPYGAYGTTVALISLGMIGRRVAELLKPFDLDIIAYEPFAKPGVAESLGVRLVPTLEDCFTQAQVVSLHAPNLPATKQMVKEHHFASMRPNATFINTARAQIIDQDALLDTLQARPDLTAVIDVTDPVEPPPAGSRYYTLPNVFLTPHIAGSVGNEVARLADYVIDEADRFMRRQPLKYAVSEAMLETMA